jgi:hypothetical protein
MRWRHHQSGFGRVGIVVVVVVLAAIGGIGLIVARNKHVNLKTTFSSTATPTSTPSSSIPTANASQPATTCDGMTQYKNAKYGISFCYPSNWRVEERDPAKSTPDAQNNELSLWLLDTTSKARAETATITVSKRDLTAETASMDGSIDSEGGNSANYKQNLTLKNKAVVKYTIPQSSTVNREIYLFQVGAKTYSIQTVYEETNLQRNPKYVTQFHALIDSAQLP